MFALWPGDTLNFSIFIKPTFGFAGQPAASPAGHIANTNVGRHASGQFRVQMNDKDILKLKFGLATVSLIFLLIGSRLLFDQWTSINWSFWFFIGLIAYFGVYRTFRLLTSKNIQIIFYDFEVAGTMTYVVVIALATIMFLIFYPLISLFFFGLSLATLSIFGGLKFITFDFGKNKVDGLFESQESTLKMTVDIHSDNNQIDIKTVDRDDILFIKREEYSDKVWTQLVDNFQKIKVRT
jgi:hypothetical protein